MSKLPKGYEIINDAPYAILGKGEVIITDTYWEDENGNITDAGIYFHSALDKPRKIGEKDFSKEGEIVDNNTIVFGVKSPTIESLKVLRDTVDRAINRLKNASNKMTKLTKEQIEQERVKFEAYMKTSMSFYCEYGGLRMSSDVDYINLAVDAGFKCWLARAELDKGN